jgi:hypothetical protein
MEGGKSRDSYVDFICFFIYKENKRLVEGLCWAQNVLFGAKSVISKIMLKMEEWHWYRIISKFLCDPLSMSFHQCYMHIFNQINNPVRWTSGLNLGDFKQTMLV